MNSEQRIMKNGGVGMRKKQSCIDCLHCKVSAKSTADVRLCYCAKEGKEAQYQEPYWSEKKVCGEFDDMGPRPRITAPPRASRGRPLLKGADFLGGLSFQ
jgi:hypothetical protein